MILLRKRAVMWSMIVTLTLGAFSSGVVMTRVFTGCTASRFRFDRLLAQLQQDQIRANSSWADISGNVKPIAMVEKRTKEEEPEFVTCTYAHDSEFLILYSRNGKLFAAQYVEGVRRSREV